VSSSRRRPSAVTRFDSTLIAVVSLSAALGAVVASAAPSGLGVTDALFRAATAALVTLAASRARRAPGLILAGTACAVAHDLLLIPSAAALVLSLLVTTQKYRLRLVGAVVGALSIQVLLRQDPIGFHGLTTIIGTAAVLPVLYSADKVCRPATRRRNRLIVEGLGALLFLAAVGFAAALLLARHDLELGASGAKAALVAARAGDARTAQRELRIAGQALQRSGSLTGSWWAAPGRAVPIVGQQAKAVSVVTSEGREVVRSARITAAVGDYRRLKYRSARFDVARLRALQRPLADSAAALDHADHRLSGMDRSWLLGPLRSRLDAFAGEIARATPEAGLASSIIRLAPDLLGADGTRHYFIAFITPAELRGVGGFVGNYGELDLNQVDGLLFKCRDDPRVTRVGHVLRHWSLDELPQLWNVARGDMSIVGPRPPLPSEVERYDTRVRRRLRVKPGLTGLWQVSGRSSLSWEEGIQLDLHYIETWSLATDIAIIAKTAKAVALRQGAY
jgi:hypothetical protein